MNYSKIIVVECILLACLAMFFLLPPKDKEKIISIPFATINNSKKEEIKYSAWVPYWKQNEAVESLQSMKDGKLSEVMPVWYELDSSGQVVESKYIEREKLKDVATEKKIKIVPTLTNSTPEGFDGQRVTRLIENGETEIDKLVDLAKSNQYSGWDLDLEEIKISDKDKFVNFVQNLSKKLHANKLTLSVTVHAQSGDDNWIGSKGQDIQSLGNYADTVRVMAYDFHNSNSDSGPITPTADLRKTIEYTLGVVPKEKIAICLPTYGYDWSTSGVTPLQFEDMNHLVFKNSVGIERDTESFEMTGEYYKGSKLHTIWYQDYESLLKKIEVSKTYDITSFCFWNLGGEDQEFWDKI